MRRIKRECLNKLRQPANLFDHLTQCVALCTMDKEIFGISVFPDKAQACFCLSGITDYGHTMTKFLILSGPNSTPTPK